MNESIYNGVALMPHHMFNFLTNYKWKIAKKVV